jgi:hypothetical protein
MKRSSEFIMGNKSGKGMAVEKEEFEKNRRSIKIS